MAEFRWIHMSLFLILLLHFTAVTGQLISFLVREGEDVTLPCNDVTDDRDKCGRTSWTLTGSKTSGPVELVTHGKINETAKDRLSVTENCSLVIEKVTAQDAGQYICERSRSGRSQRYLSVVNMTEDEDEDDAEVTLTCSVSAPAECRHTAKWLFEGKDVKKVIKHQTSQPGCSAKVTFPKSRDKKSEDPELFKCEVVDNHSAKVQQFIFSPQSSGEDEKEEEDEKMETTKTTTVKPATEATPAVTSSPATATEPNATSPGWWAFIAVPVVLAALVVVLLIRRKRTKGQKTQVDPNTVTFKPTDPEDGVSYASISYNKTNSKPRVKGNNGDDDEDDAVTYTTVKVPSTDPSTPDT